MSNTYRKIYVENYGPIPREPNGRTYDIHHKDGNNANNHPKNLVALSLQEHYNIHKKQGDVKACFITSLRLKLDPKITSQLASEANKVRIKEKTHNFLIPNFQKNEFKKRIKNKTHNFLKSNLIEKTCPGCGRKGSGGSFKRWHFDRCRIIST